MVYDPLINENILDSLTVDERLIIVSLPYRAGLWISVSDQTGGDKADAKELLALSNIIAGFASQVFGSEMLHYIMEETLARKKEWEGWTADIENVPKEAEACVDVLRRYVAEKDVNAYVFRVMEIAEAVALAFREYENMTLGDKIRLYWMYICHRVFGRIRKEASKSFDQFLRISIDERKALNLLAQSMGTRYAS